MGLRLTAAILAARVLSFGCKIAGKQGVTMAGKLAMKIDPDVLKKLSAQVKGNIFVVCGTNGKTTTNNLLCSALEAEGLQVVCNHTGSNMLAGVTAAFVLNAAISGKLKADAACIEVDEASAQRVFPHMTPNICVITNLFRDQLDRYGEIDITIALLKKAFAMAPEMKLVINADDSLVTALAQESALDYVTFGISEQVFSHQDSQEIREGRFCRRCGSALHYDFYHYAQMGTYHCPACDFRRPPVDFDAKQIDMRQGLAFAVGERSLRAPYRGFYNIYNILAAYAALAAGGIAPEHFEQMLGSFNPQNGRNEQFVIGNTTVLLNLAKNPAGFNQNISSVMEDEREKDLIIVINDNAQDGTDISWLWDVDFDRLCGDRIRSITVSGIRCQDMRLRLKYVDIPSTLIFDVKEAIYHVLKEGSKNLYVLVNYTALYSTHQLLGQIQKEAAHIDRG